MGRRSTRSTRNDRAPPPCSPTTIRSPRRSSPSRRNTAGPRRESTGPTITAGPASPGRGPGSYQPARSVAGTSIVLSARNPTGTTRASTPAAAIAIDTGRPPPTRPTAARVGAASPSCGPPATPWHPTSARHPANTATAPTTRQPRLPGRPIATAENRTRRRRVLRPRAHGTRTRGTRTRGTRTRRCRVPRWGTLPPPGIGARRAVHNPRPGGPVPTSGRDPHRGCGCARQSTSPCGRNGGDRRSPGAPAARAVAAGGRDQQDGEDEGGADEGQAGCVVGAGDGAAEAGVDALRGRDRVVGG